MNLTCKGIVALLLSSCVLGCQSTKVPDWYSLPQTNNPDYITAIGEGMSLEQAKKSALGNVSAVLWTQVNSSFAMDDTHRSIDAKHYSNAYINNKVNTTTADISLSGVEYINIANVDNMFYAQAQVKKSTLINQLDVDVSHINQKASAQLEKLTHQDALLWWLDNKDSSSYSDYVSVRLAILSSLSPNIHIKTDSVDELIKQTAKVKSAILINIQPSRNDKNISRLMAEKFSVAGFSTTFNKTSEVTHTLVINSELRQSIISDAFISTQITKLQLINKNNKIIGSGEIISTGNSLSNYKISKEGAQRHFAALIDKRGFWQTLGLNSTAL